MRGTPERGDAGGDAGEGVGARRARQPHGGGRGVLLVIGVQDEDQVHRARQHRIDRVLLGRHGERHVQEVLGVFEIVLGIDEGLADRVFVGHRRDRRHLGDEPVAGDDALTRVVDVGAVVVEGRERADHAAHDRHRMRIAAEAAEEGRELLVHHGVHGDVALELLLLGGGRQLAVQQEVGGLHEIAVLGQLLDRIAAVEQLALVAVDIGDLGLAAARGGKAGIEGEMAEIGVKPPDVHHLGAQRPRQQRQLDRLAGGIVGDRTAFARSQIMVLAGGRFDLCVHRLRP